MVDIGGKPDTVRRAVAQGRIRMSAETLAMVKGGTAKKGDVLGIARIAGIQAAKRTDALIPLCHAIPLTRLTVEFQIEDNPPAILCLATAETVGRTGVEMEALTATSVCLLTIYDMCKSADRGMRMEGIRLLEKEGGRSGHWRADAGE